MKSKYFLLFLVLIQISCKPLKQGHGFYHKYVSAFYDKETKEPIIIYDKYNGKATDTLKALKTESAQCYYKFAFNKSKNGWIKIETMRIIPCENNKFNANVYKYHNNWIKAQNLIITTSDCEDCINVNLYEFPNKSSKVIYSISKYIETTLIEVDGNWAKVVYQKDNEKIIGWLPREYQCTSPWTNCIFN